MAAFNEDDFIDHLANTLVNEHPSSGPAVAAGLFSGGRLADILKRLRAAGVTLGSILKMLGPIIAIFAAGGSWQQILAAIFGLFHIPVPVTAPPTTSAPTAP